jgi:(p)ppGpp synthase/HD superfamily hydrolase
VNILTQNNAHPEEFTVGLTLLRQTQQKVQIRQWFKKSDRDAMKILLL